MNAETAQNEKKVEDPKTNPEEGQVKTEDPQTEDKKTETKPTEAVEPNSAAVNNLRVLENIEVKLTVEVGNTEIAIKDLLRLNEGSVVELDRLAGDPLDILANGTKIAKGEVVMVGEKFGIRFTEVVAPEELVQNL
ncbi:MAG: flagellar motor switch protein FliN [Rickettsiales bacterium]|jgi:flagellar motor switch protein FliN/FliY|nr:flagellar motor switch protein FliN [Rickettsiales bacterium]OUT46952.1 MAG: flagellar motor switch protein FliN [Pelagibacteraceae bacterium TMED13]|tara:strand:+ start:940 stop:1347 length:408 start_codon:yes stop_codon:yes gene_type:complete